MALSSLDLAVMGAYFAMVLAVGVYFKSKAGDASDYFLGRHEIPWWAVMLSIVATETSALTVISVPGIGARGDLTFLQLPLGYIIGRFAVAAWLIPGYYRGDQETAYTRLEQRYGPTTRKTASMIFMIIRSLGDSVRVFATAIPLAVITGWSIALSVLVVCAVALAYTWAGGIKAVVWVDVMQLLLYVIGGVVAVTVASSLIGGIGPALEAAARAGKLEVLDLTPSWSVTYTFWGGLIGGALLSTASHGTDHLIVQRLMSTRDATSAQRALIGSGFLVLAQFALFLLVGTFIWAALGDQPGTPGDRILPEFVVSHFPAGLAGLVIAGILAAAMSTVSSSLNSLAAAVTYDFYAPLTQRAESEHLAKVGRAATLVWAMVLGGLALLFESNDQPVVVLALSIASITYGGLLGSFVMASVAKGSNQVDVITAIVGSSGFMTWVVLLKPRPFAELAWPWYVPLGLATALVLGWSSQAFRLIGSKSSATS